MKLIIFFSLFLCSCVAVSAQNIYTVAGGGLSLGDGGPATAASTPNPGWGKFDAAGNYYFCESASQPRLRRINPDGIITTVAGDGIGGYSGDGGPATAAELGGSFVFDVDSSGNIFVADLGNSRLRKVSKATGIISTIAGNGVATTTGDGGPATASTTRVSSLCVDKIGNIYLVDSNGSWIRKIDTSGIISYVAGNGVPGNTGDGGAATNASFYAENLVMDTSGNLIVNSIWRIRKIDLATGIVNNFAGKGDTFYNGDEIPADSANFVAYYVFMDEKNQIYIAEEDRIRYIDTNWIIHTITGNGVGGYTGDGGPATAAEINNAEGVAKDVCGNVWIADESNSRIRKIVFDASCSLGPTDSLSLGVRNRSLPGIQVYPNPVQDRFSIKAVVPLNAVSVVNAMGVTMYRSEDDSALLSIDVEGYPPGLYTVIVTCSDGSEFIERIVKE